jgi:hypothetical protein
MEEFTMDRRRFPLATAAPAAPRPGGDIDVLISQPQRDAQRPAGR